VYAAELLTHQRAMAELAHTRRQGVAARVLHRAVRAPTSAPSEGPR
jgi:hypothetical protein